jgi:ribonuclease HIII
MTLPFVTTLLAPQAKPLQELLEENGFSFSQRDHTLFSAKKKGLSITLYASLKLTVQGKESDEFIRYMLEPFLGTFSYTMKKDGLAPEESIKAHIGTDEAGKGDFFGPLVVAGVFINSTTAPILLKLGIKDSKLLSDKKICEFAPKIATICPNYIVRLMPEKYNELYERFGNLNHLLAWCHATVIDHLVQHSQCLDVLVDKFAHESLIEKALIKKKVHCRVEQRIKAESDLAVAAASCLARWGFLQGIEMLSKDATFTIPKGSSAANVVESGKKIVKMFSTDALKHYTKVHFKLTHSLC